MKIVPDFKLPTEIAKISVKPQVLAQAVRVYRANQRQGTQSVLTRAEVNRTRKKLYKQKGTGGARHGDRKAPIFVGGSVSFAPKPRDYSLSMPTKMKRQAILGALALKNKSKQLVVVEGFSKSTGRTAEMAKVLDLLVAGKFSEGKTKVLLVTDVRRENIWRAGRNILNLVILPWQLVNTYEVLRADLVVVMEEALGGGKVGGEGRARPVKSVPKKAAKK